MCAHQLTKYIEINWKIIIPKLIHKIVYANGENKYKSKKSVSNLNFLCIVWKINYIFINSFSLRIKMINCSSVLNFLLQIILLYSKKYWVWTKLTKSCFFKNWTVIFFCLLKLLNIQLWILIYFLYKKALIVNL